MAPQLNAGKIITITLLTVIILYMLQILTYFLQRMRLTLTHLGSGKFKTSETEEIVFEYAKTEPFTISGYINLKEMEEGDTIIIREYVKLATNGDYTLYAEEEYNGKQKEPILHISKRPAMNGIKITIQQTKGTFKQVSWEFYGGVVG
ncbi:MAG: hypothetical protein QXO00_02390 [Candidatus Bathyarchaeia archaeon]